MYKIGQLQFKLVLTDPEKAFDWWSTNTFRTPLRCLAFKGDKGQVHLLK